jgi:hypothetical protein
MKQSRQNHPKHSVPRTGIALVKPGPSAALVREALDNLLYEDLGPAALHLETARGIWQNYPELVEAATFPEHLKEAYAAYSHGDKPRDRDTSDSLNGIDRLFTPAEIAAHREKQLPKAREVAQGWIRHGIVKRSA